MKVVGIPGDYVKNLWENENFQRVKCKKKWEIPSGVMTKLTGNPWGSTKKKLISLKLRFTQHKSINTHI